MINCTDPLTCNYNLTNLINNNPINDTPGFLSAVNGLSQDYAIITIVLIASVVLFLVTKERMGQTQAAAFTGVVTSIFTVMLFAISTGGIKLITGSQLLIVLILTATAIYINTLQNKY